MMFRTIVFVALFVSGDCEKYFRDPHHQHEGHHDFATPPPPKGSESERHVVSKRSSCQNCHPISSVTKMESLERVVGIQTIRPTTTRTFLYGNDSCYYFEVNVPIQFTCRLRDVAYIRWKVWKGYGMKTEWVANDTLTLLLTPDDDDRNLNLSCEGAHAPDESNISKKITITLGLSTSSSITKTKRNYKLTYLEKGKSLSMNSSCQVLSHKLGNNVSFKYNSRIVIENFNEVQNGTEFSCIYYQKSQSLYSQIFKQAINTFETIRTRSIFYLGDETDNYTTRSATGKTNTGTSSEVTKENKHDEFQSSPAAMVGYVLGAVAMVSVGVILGIWFKSMLLRRAARNDDVNQVIYTEIEVKPRGPPPPPRNDTPYAQIIGTLVPKQQVTENAYATIDVCQIIK